jgi:ELWxxDGT repeat protein
MAPRFAQLLFLICITLSASAATQQPYLVRDLADPIRGQSSLSTSSLWITIGDISWFNAYAGDGEGSQVWKTDGTPAGTVRLTGGHHAAQNFVGVVNGRILYEGSFAGRGSLYALDQDGGEPVDLAAATPGDFHPGGIEYRGAFYMASTATFGNPPRGLELWRTDGTRDGTAFIDLNPGVNGSQSDGTLMVAGDWIVFAGETAQGKGLFRTDGTVGGTTRLVEIPGKPGDARLTRFGDKVVFAVDGSSPYRRAAHAFRRQGRICSRR